jgi:hypothetical protein
MWNDVVVVRVRCLLGRLQHSAESQLVLKSVCLCHNSLAQRHLPSKLLERSIVAKKREKLKVAFGYATIENDFSSCCKGATLGGSHR